MIKSEPAVTPAIVVEIFFLSFNYFQREVVIGHNPERIGVGMGGEEVTKVDSSFTL